MELLTIRLDGKVALVTGSGSGIGEAIALGLGAVGADVVVTELPHFLERARDVAARITERGSRALVVPVDVTKLESIHECVREVYERWGRVNILVNNAGGGLRKLAFDVTEEDWDCDLRLNLKSVFFCSQIVARRMATDGGGKIVNIASIFGLVGGASGAPYAAAKGGVVNLTRALAVEWARYHINVNCVAPTYTVTPHTEVVRADRERYEDIVRRTPLGRWAEPAEVAAGVVFLAGPAADMITGHTLAIDGGWTAW